jgi:hypothetical protein
VKMQQIIDDEEQPLEDLKTFHRLSDANSFAEDKTKEYHSKGGATCYQAQAFKDDMSSIRIWVATEIVSSSKIPSLDPKSLEHRFPTNTWLIRFKVVKDIFDHDSETWGTHTMTDILSNHHYSNVELANHAAFNHLIQVLKPPRPNLDHLEQYENDMIPEIRKVRDVCCEQKEPFECGIEKSEDQAQWLEATEVGVEVVCYQMQGPLN